MRVNLLGQSLGLSLGLRWSDRLGRTAVTHAGTMHTVLSVDGAHGLVERTDRLEALLRTESFTAADTGAADTLWRTVDIGHLAISDVVI